MLKLENVTIGYGGRTLFSELSVEYGRGLFALSGPNGTGKSTILKSIAGILQPIEGRVFVDGIDLYAQPAAAKGKMSFMPDKSYVYPFMTGEDLIKLVAYSKKISDFSSIYSDLSRYRLDRYLHSKFDTLSYGTQKKFMLIVAMIGAPAVMLLDEPVNGIDGDAKLEMAEYLRNRGFDRTIVFTNHDKKFVCEVGATNIDINSLLHSSVVY